MLRDVVKLCERVIMSLGALACILVFVVWLYGLKPEDVRGHMHIGWMGWMWLVAGMVLFGISLWSSGYSLYVGTRKNRLVEAKAEKWKAECQRVTAEAQTKLDDQREGHERMNGEREGYLRAECNKLLEERDRRCKVDVDRAEAFAKSANDDARELQKKLEEKDAQTTALLPFTLSPLQREAFVCAKRLRDWISIINPLFTPP